MSSVENDEIEKERIQGNVKFFNYERGYGFAEVDGEDYFIHVTNIENSDILLSDEEVSFVPAEGHKGLQALEVRRVNPPSMDQETGSIKVFYPDDGYGFIGRDGKADVFLHLTDVIEMNGHETLEEGMDVQFSVRQGRDGRDRAYKIEILD